MRRSPRRVITSMAMAVVVVASAATSWFLLSTYADESMGVSGFFQSGAASEDGGAVSGFGKSGTSGREGEQMVFTDGSLGDSSGDNPQLGQSGGGEPSLGQSGGQGDLSLGQSGGEACCSHEGCPGEGCQDDPCLECCNVVSDMYIEDGEWVKVGTLAEFTQAIKDQKPKIRLTSNIALTEYIPFTHSMTIDGTKEDGSGYWTFADRMEARNLRFNASDLTVTMQNMIIDGHDHYAPVGQGGGVSQSTVIYDNVTYTGPQLGYMRRDGTLIVRNSHITIMNKPNANEMGEVSEASQVIFEGNVTINRSQVDGDSMFWMVNESGTRPGLIKVSDGAKVTINNTSSYLMYRTTMKNLDFIVGDGAELDIQVRTGWTIVDGHRFDNMIIGNNSQVTMSQSTNSKLPRTYLFDINSRLEVGMGSTLIVEGAGDAGIRLTTTSATVAFHNPELVRLDYGLVGYAPSQVVMTGKAFNYWKARAVSGEPDALLNAPYGELITVNYSEGKASGHYIDVNTGHTVGYTDLNAFLPFGNSQTRFVMGRYGHEVDTMTGNITRITGAVSQNAQVTVGYFFHGSDVNDPANRVTTAAEPYPDRNTPSLSGYQVVPQGGSEGGNQNLFALDQDILFDIVRPLPHSGTQLTNATTRLYSQEVRHYPQPGQLMIVSFPQLLDFGRHAIPGVGRYFPLVADAEMVVVDTRIDPEPESSVWTLTARATPLEDDDGRNALDVSALGVLRDGQFTSFVDAPKLWQGAPSEGVYTHTKVWEAEDEENGLVVYVTPQQAAAAQYEAKVTWTLSIGL